VIVDCDESGDNVKVADFGIARAGASEITEVGAIMGTAQYLSPEQAQGSAVHEPSDLYSIGVVLFEMLTGRPPFEGDSAVAIALKHVSQPAPSPREFRPEIPPELEEVVLTALAKDPEQRYGDADSFIRALDAAGAALDGRFDRENTARFAPTPAPEPAGIAAAAAPPPLVTDEGGPGVPPTGAAETPPDVEPGPQPPSARRRLLWILLFGALAALVLGGFLLLRPQQVQVPLVLGQTLDSARQELERDGFAVDIDRRSDQAPLDTVFRQVPRGGQEADEGSTVTLFVSNGPSTAEVPDVLGLGVQDARKRVKRAGFRPAVEREGSTKVLEGSVIRSDPGPGVAIERGSKVTLFVSTGPRAVTVPDVVGQDQKEAASRLSQEGLNVVVRERSSSEQVDTVVAQTPSGGQQINEGSTVTLFVSNGRLREVPDVVGLEQAEAEVEIRDAGFGASVRTKDVEEPDRDGRVLSQTPSGGKERRKGDTVVITVGKLTAPPPPAPGETGAAG
jgi:serine/threonine-protein kinase